MDNYYYSDLIKKSTGESNYEEYKYMEYPLDRFIVKVKLSSDNKFLGIEEIKVNKDFMNYQQKSWAYKFADVDEYYE